MVEEPAQETNKASDVLVVTESNHCMKKIKQEDCAELGRKLLERLEHTNLDANAMSQALERHC